jgi:hypothetical protein
VLVDQPALERAELLAVAPWLVAAIYGWVREHRCACELHRMSEGADAGLSGRRTKQAQARDPANP